MSYSSPPGSVQHVKEIFHSQSATYTVKTTDTDANPHFFAKWQIIRDGSLPPLRLGLLVASVLAVLRVDVGIDEIIYGIYESVDNITYNFYVRIQNGAVVKTAFNSILAGSFIPETSNYLAIATHNVDGATSGIIERFTSEMLLHLPPGHSIKRIL